MIDPDAMVDWWGDENQELWDFSQLRVIPGYPVCSNWLLIWGSTFAFIILMFLHLIDAKDFGFYPGEKNADGSGLVDMS